MSVSSRTTSRPDSHSANAHPQKPQAGHTTPSAHTKSLVPAVSIARRARSSATRIVRDVGPARCAKRTASIPQRRKRRSAVVAVPHLLPPLPLRHESRAPRRQREQRLLRQTLPLRRARQRTRICLPHPPRLIAAPFFPILSKLHRAQLLSQMIRPWSDGARGR